MHYKGDIVNSFLKLCESCLVFVHSIVTPFKLLEIHYIEEGFHVGTTHILFCWMRISLLMIQSDSLCGLQGMLYAVRWIRLIFVIWYLIRLMNFNMGELLKVWNRSFMCLSSTIQIVRLKVTNNKKYTSRLLKKWQIRIWENTNNPCLLADKTVTCIFWRMIETFNKVNVLIAMAVMTKFYEQWKGIRLNCHNLWMIVHVRLVMRTTCPEYN